jgi:hypothetical protein
MIYGTPAASLHLPESACKYIFLTLGHTVTTAAFCYLLSVYFIKTKRGCDYFVSASICLLISSIR